MKKILVLSQEIFNLYWNGHVQKRTPDIDIIKRLLKDAKDRGEKLGSYRIDSNLSTGYSVEDLLAESSESI
jgi:hypothetical protein